MTFELITGDYLFDPKKGKTYRKNDDHLAQMTELIGDIDNVRWLKSCENWEDFYTPSIKLKRIKETKDWPVFKVLTEKYRLKHLEAQLLADFLGKMLRWSPSDRPSAREMLKHPWFKMPVDYHSYMSKGF